MQTTNTIDKENIFVAIQTCVPYQSYTDKLSRMKYIQICQDDYQGACTTRITLRYKHHANAKYETFAELNILAQLRLSTDVAVPECFACNGDHVKVL